MVVDGLCYLLFWTAAVTFRTVVNKSAGMEILPMGYYFTYDYWHRKDYYGDPVIRWFARHARLWISQHTVRRTYRWRRSEGTLEMRSQFCSPSQLKRVRRERPVGRESLR
jgi:hypothetical protein